MMNKIKQIMGLDKTYIDLTFGNEKAKKKLKLVRIPLNRNVVIIAVIILAIAIVTPFTNFFLIPLALWILRRFA